MLILGVKSTVHTLFNIRSFIFSLTVYEWEVSEVVWHSTDCIPVEFSGRAKQIKFFNEHQFNETKLNSTHQNQYSPLYTSIFNKKFPFFMQIIIKIPFSI